MKRALVICADAWHPAQTVKGGLAPLGAGGFEFEFLENGAERLAEMLPQFSIAVLAKANMLSAADQRPWLSPGLAAAFRDHVRRGCGLVVIHAGTSRYEQSPGMGEMIGGAFRSHPDPCPVTLEPAISCPLTTGVDAFTVRDEHYFVSLNDPQAMVFLNSQSEHGVQPAGWTRNEGAGRVCALTPGHSLEVWRHPSFQKLLLNALGWAAKIT